MTGILALACFVTGFIVVRGIMAGRYGGGLEMGLLTGRAVGISVSDLFKTASWVASIAFLPWMTHSLRETASC